MLVRGSVNGYRKLLQQSGVSADVIIMVMGIEDGGEFQVLLVQVVQHRRGIARVDHNGMMRIANDPDVIISECANGNDMRYGHGRGMVK
jgi:hypothetical protein